MLVDLSDAFNARIGQTLQYQLSKAFKFKVHIFSRDNKLVWKENIHQA